MWAEIKKDKNALPRPPAMGATHVEEELHNVPKVAFLGPQLPKRTQNISKCNKSQFLRGTSIALASATGPYRSADNAILCEISSRKCFPLVGLTLLQACMSPGATLVLRLRRGGT